jgi:hypothetical protein
MTNEPQALSQRLAAGRLPVCDGVRLAVQLGATLRSVHDEGRVQGVLNPDVVILNGSDVELTQEPGAAEGITPYTAPELLHEQAPDVRSDIFAFGAIVYEMLTGRCPFEGDSAEALAESIATGVPALTGLSGFDRLIFTCLSKDPADRWQRMQHVVAETRLAATLYRAENGAQNRQTEMKTLRAEVEMLESRLASQLDKYEAVIAQMQSEVTEELSRQQVALAQAASETLHSVGSRFDETECQIDCALGRAVNAEQAAARALGEILSLHGAVNDELRGLEAKVTAQSSAIASGRDGVARTDDLVERVVEALEVLQGMVLEQSEQRVTFADR